MKNSQKFSYVHEQFHYFTPSVGCSQCAVIDRAKITLALGEVGAMVIIYLIITCTYCGSSQDETGE